MRIRAQNSSYAGVVLTLFPALLIFCLFPATPCFGDNNAESREYLDAPMPSPDDLAEMNLEDLMNIQVTSVSRRPEHLSDTAAAVYVITQEDIRRSGLHTIAELLRLAPGMEVQRLDSNRWAVTSRGFNSIFANKLLVLMDGRTVYDPMWGGTYWDLQDTLLEDVDRIEVIRGPGGTIWGANAVNGVINIITKKAGDTQGNLDTVLIGSEERTIDGVRYGGGVGRNGSYRVYAKRTRNDAFIFPTDITPTGPWTQGERGWDAWEQWRAGFRTDFDTSKKSSLTIQGDWYKGSTGQPIFRALLEPPYSEVVHDLRRVWGANVLARWQRATSERTDTTLQAYYNLASREDVRAFPVYATVDIDLTQHVRLSRKHDLIWGLDLRYTSDGDDTDNGAWNPSHQKYRKLSAFVQDEIKLSPNRLRLTLGSKVEHNDYVGSEIQPTIRLLWTPRRRETGWMAISRAIRTPTRVERTKVYRIATIPPVPPSTLPTAIVMFGDSGLSYEHMMAYEMGYRRQPTDRLSLDLAAYYNIYCKVLTLHYETPYFDAGPPAHMVLPYVYTNGVKGRISGLELAANWQATSRWKLSAGITNMRIDLTAESWTGANASAVSIENNSPRKQINLRSYLDLPNNLEFDTLLFYRGKLGSNTGSYPRLDVRLGWRPRGGFEMVLGAHNLLKAEHREYGSAIERHTYVQRDIYGQATWKL